MAPARPRWTRFTRYRAPHTSCAQLNLCLNNRVLEFSARCSLREAAGKMGKLIRLELFSMY